MFEEIELPAREAVRPSEAVLIVDDEPMMGEVLKEAVRAFAHGHVDHLEPAVVESVCGETSGTQTLPFERLRLNLA